MHKYGFETALNTFNVVLERAQEVLNVEKSVPNAIF